MSLWIDSKNISYPSGNRSWFVSVVSVAFLVVVFWLQPRSVIFNFKTQLCQTCLFQISSVKPLHIRLPTTPTNPTTRHVPYSTLSLRTTAEEKKSAPTTPNQSLTICNNVKDQGCCSQSYPLCTPPPDREKHKHANQQVFKPGDPKLQTGGVTISQLARFRPLLSMSLPLNLLNATFSPRQTDWSQRPFKSAQRRLVVISELL